MASDDEAAAVTGTAVVKSKLTKAQAEAAWRWERGEGRRRVEWFIGQEAVSVGGQERKYRRPVVAWIVWCLGCGMTFITLDELTSYCRRCRSPREEVL